MPLTGGYVAVDTYDVEADTFPLIVEELIPSYTTNDHHLMHRRATVSSETAAGTLAHRRWRLKYSLASATQYARALELYDISRGGALGLNWSNQHFTRGGATESVIVRMAQGPLKVRRTIHGRYEFEVVLEEMRVGP